MKTDRRESRREALGFTRVELVTVVAMLTCLSVLQFAWAGSHRGQAWAAQCVDNFGRLIRAWQMYAADSDGWFPPNRDDGSTTPGFNWASGNAGLGGGQEYDSGILTNAPTSLLAPYLRYDPSVFRCPGDLRQGRYQGTDASLRGSIVPAARSVAMNVAVGTEPGSLFSSTGGRVATDGAWLDNNHGHINGKTWRTYGREGQLTVPGPALTSVLIEEDELSLNDSVLSFGMERAEWIDWPATRHDLAATLAFADGHVEMHRWVDPRTRLLSFPSRVSVPGSEDYLWLRDRTSARLP